MNRHHWSLALGVVFSALALITLSVWIPLDIDSGVTETLRRRVEIGDAMAPTMVTVGILLVSLWLAGDALFRLGGDRRPGGRFVLDAESLAFMRTALAVFVAGFALMLWTGPLIVDLFNALGAGIGSYRQLRDTVPYKYLGFFAGGFVMVFGFISMVEHRLGWRLAGVSLAAVVAIAALFDLPFEDLLLPPNGDQ
jgi:hypothetical protein